MSGVLFTDPKSAKRFVDWAKVDGKRVLEPNGGDGALVSAMSLSVKHLTTIEILPEFAEKLRQVERPARRYKVIEGDFLKIKPDKPVDVVVMNPPYEKGADVDHIEHALECVVEGGRVCCLVRANFVYLKGTFTRILSKAALTRQALFVARGARFYGPDAVSKTGEIETPRHDYACFEFTIVKGMYVSATSHRPVLTEWWA